MRFSLIGLGLALLMPRALATPVVFPLEQVRPGLEGYALTAGAGNLISKFPVRVEGLVYEAGDAPRVLVRASGAFIEASGGIAAGMSGSPVYFKDAAGKDTLAGAVSAGFPNADHKLALVTPIELMLRALPTNVTASTGGPFLERLLTHHGVPGLGVLLPKAVPLATPLLLAGFSGRAGAALLEDLRARGANVTLGALQAGAGLGSPPARPYKLEPGAPISVQLVGGDLLLGAVGTVTLLEGKQFLAFGHGMLGQAHGRYLAAPAYVNAIVPASDVPFKLAENINKPFGVVSSDRPYAVGGSLLTEIPSLPFEIALKTPAGSRTLRLNLAPTEALTAPLVYASVLSTLDNTLEGSQAGSASIALTYGFVDRSVTFRDRVASEDDVARVVARQVASAVALLVENPFKAPELARLKLTLELSAFDLTRVVKAEPETRQVKPGQVVTLNLRLQPWRAPAFVRRINFRVPNDASAGELRLNVRGGLTPRRDTGRNDDPFEGILGFDDLLERLRNRISGDNVFVETNDEDPTILAVDGQNGPVAGLVSFKLDIKP